MHYINNKEERFLIIGDEVEKLNQTANLLQISGYSQIWIETDSANIATAITEFQPDIIVLDIRSRLSNGSDMLQLIKPLIPSETFLPVLVLTSDYASEKKMRALATGAIDFLSQPFNSVEMILRVGDLLSARHLALDLRARRTRQENSSKGHPQEVVLSEMQMLEHLAFVAKRRDDVTGTHIRRIGVIVELLALELGLSSMMAALMGKAALVRDLGNIAISDSILSKPGKLKWYEFERVKTHARIGAEILKGGRSKLQKTSESIARFHHERWDGTGYERLSREAIPLEARITAVADVFDTLRNRRSYKDAWDHETAVNEIAEARGTQFDPMVVDAFLRIEPKLKALFDEAKQERPLEAVGSGA